MRTACRRCGGSGGRRAMPADALADPRHRTLLDAMAQVIGV
ncbi:hypothetical protein ACIBQ6_28420 [Nonomuraea sp. NPDC049655]